MQILQQEVVALLVVVDVLMVVRAHVREIVRMGVKLYAVGNATLHVEVLVRMSQLVRNVLVAHHLVQLIVIVHVLWHVVRVVCHVV